MHAGSKWAVAGVGGVVLLLGAAVAGLAAWAGSDDFRSRAQQAATTALGVPVQLGDIDVTFWPALAVAVRDVRIRTRPALTLAQIDATPVWSSLLLGKPALDALVVRHAVLPQQGILALVAAAQKQAPRAPAASGGSMPTLPRRIELDHVTWVDAAGQKLTVDAEVAFDGEPLPQRATLEVIDGRFLGAKARLDREDDAWQLRADIGGGTITGPLRLQAQRSGGWKLSGSMATDKVEVAALTAPSRSLTGKLEAHTSLQADFRDAGGVLDALRTQTRFTVRRAVLHGLDLAAAVHTLGMSRSGETAFDTLTGQVGTQGKTVQLSNLVANSGSLSATGQVTLSPERALSGRVHVTLAGGALGVPVNVGGTMDAPTATPAGLTLPSLFGSK